MAQNNNSSEASQDTPARNTSLQYVGVGLVVFVVVVIVGLIVVRSMRQKPQPQSSTGTFHETPTTPAEKSYAFQLSGQYNEAYKVLDEAIAKTGNNTEKASLYNEKSIAALNAKDYSFALQMAKESEKLEPTISSAHIIAESAEQLGDKKTAVEFLQKQIERIVKSGKPFIQEDIDALKQKITQLEAPQ